jgi:hypothetical protein
MKRTLAAVLLSLGGMFLTAGLAQAAELAKLATMRKVVSDSLYQELTAM